MLQSRDDRAGLPPVPVDESEPVAKVKARVPHSRRGLRSLLARRAEYRW
jgi:hypothetical protein